MILALGWVLAACSTGSIAVHGSVQSRGLCLSLVYLSGGSVVDHLRLTFRDSSGTVIATTQSGIGTFDPPKPWGRYTVCTATAPYTVELAKEDFYQVQVEGVTDQAAPVSYADLEANGFEYDIQVPSG